jgi:hypothetical protein
MLWGSGDTSKLNEDERKTLDHLRRMVETGHIVALTPAESKLAQDALNWYGRFIGFGHILQSLRNIGLLAGGLLALWWTSQGAIVEWIRNVSSP